MVPAKVLPLKRYTNMHNNKLSHFPSWRWDQECQDYSIKCNHRTSDCVVEASTVCLRYLPANFHLLESQYQIKLIDFARDKKIVVVFYRNLSETKERVHHRHLKLQRISSKPKSDKFLQWISSSSESDSYLVSSLWPCRSPQACTTLWVLGSDGIIKFLPSENCDQVIQKGETWLSFKYGDNSTHFHSLAVIVLHLQL